jgi:hypothetical protein
MLAECSCFASLIVTPRGYKGSVVTLVQPTSSYMISHHFSTSFSGAKKKEKNRETDVKETRGVVELTREASLFPFRPIAKSSWPASEVTQEHLQNLISQGHMIAAELGTCRVHMDLASPAPVRGYDMVCATFY